MMNSCNDFICNESISEIQKTQSIFGRRLVMDKSASAGKCLGGESHFSQSVVYIIQNLIHLNEFAEKMAKHLKSVQVIADL